MIDLYFDNKQVTIKCTRNVWRVTATIFVPDKHSYYDNVNMIYDNIYLPLSLHRCLILKDAMISFIDPPRMEGQHLFQEVEFVGKDMDMMSMDEYLRMEKNKE